MNRKNTSSTAVLLYIRTSPVSYAWLMAKYIYIIQYTIVNSLKSAFLTAEVVILRCLNTMLKVRINLRGLQTAFVLGFSFLFYIIKNRFGPKYSKTVWEKMMFSQRYLSSKVILIHNILSLVSDCSEIFFSFFQKIG